MDELKKTQKPPFYSIVKTRHTGGTPFRDSKLNSGTFKPLKKPVLNLPANTRGRDLAQKNFEFKATLTETKKINARQPQTVVQTAPSRIVNKNILIKNVIKEPLRNLQTAKTKETKKIKSDESDKENQGFRTQRTIQKNKDTQLLDSKARPQRTRQVKPISKPEIKPRPQSKLAAKKPPAKNAVSVNNKLNDIANTNHNVLTSKEKIICNVQSLNPKVNQSNARQTRSRTIAQKEAQTTETLTNQNSQSEKKENLNDKNKIDAVEDSITKEREARKNGANFHRTRLQNEITRLTNEVDTWNKRREEEIPENIKDEILAVVGQTKLLISDKFQSFKSLIDKCDSDQRELIVTLEDLEGFWDMMYQQVEQLDRRFRTLIDLEENNWQEKKVVPCNRKSKKTTKKPTKAQPATSKFREFLKAKQNKSEKPATPPRSSLEDKQNGDDTSVYLSASRDDMPPFESLTDVLKTPKSTPALQRTLNNSRRSSAGLIILKQRLLIKSISSHEK